MTDAITTNSNAMARGRRRRKSFDVADLEVAVAAALPQPIVDAIAGQCAELPRLKGENLAPGVTRIRGDLCNVHGRYGSCSGAGYGSAPKPKLAKPGTSQFFKRQPLKGGKGGGKKGSTAKRGGGGKGKDPAVLARQAKRDAEHEADRADRQKRQQERDIQRSQDRMERAMRQQAADQRRAAHAAQREQDRKDRLARQAKLDKQREQRAGSGGKGGSAQGDRSGGREAVTIDKSPIARDTAAKVGLPSDAFDALKKAAEEGGVQHDALAKLGLIDQDGFTSDQGRRALAALERGNVRQVQAALQDARARLAREEAARQRAAESRSRANPIGRTTIIRPKRRKALKARAPFRVFKDAAGRWRWLAISSTAYRDRDGEIVSTKALADDVMRADQTKLYGPLRWWHVPGVDLGDCDFNALDGRVLIESGTFRSEAIARKVARHAADLEVSVGFLHPPTEPDSDGVFHTIRRFERSLTPRGKASNRFTSFHVKETPMLDTVKRAALKQLGFSDDDIAGLEGQAAQTQKAADDANVAYKADEPAAPQEITLGGVTYILTEKAPPPMAAASDAEDPAETMAEGGMEEPGEAEDTAGGLTLSPEDLQAIGQAVGAALQAALGPLVGAMDLTNKMSSHMEDLKSMMGAYQTKKDAESAESAEQRETVAQLAATVKAQGGKLDELIGLQPAAVADRASASAATVVAPTDPLVVAAQKDAAAVGGQFDDLVRNLFGASAVALPPG